MTHTTQTITVAYRSESYVSFGLWIMFAICLVGNIMAGSVSTIMPVYLPAISGDLIKEFSDGRISDISSFLNAFYLAGWTIGGLTWGLIADKIGRTRSLALSVSMFGLFTLLISSAQSWELLMLFRFLSGFGVGGTLVMNTTFLTEVWPEKTREVFVGILSIGFPIGIVSSGTLNYMIPQWRTGFLIGTIPLIIGILSFGLLRESEKWKVSRSERTSQPNVILLKQNRANLINGAIIYGSMLIGLWAVFSWLPTWIQNLQNVHTEGQERSLGIMLLGMGGLAGGFFSGWIAKSLGTRKTMLLCFGGSFLIAVILFKTNTSFSNLVLVEIGLLAFLFGISQGMLGYYIPLLFPVSIRATSTGFCYNIGRIFTTAAVFFIGWLVNVLGGYGNSLLLFSLVFLIGFIVLFYSKKITN
ncbi:MAG TPA: MFS transporter [Bacteroidales bacterium]|nr:MFS transporter [Bacteroidales bacterium]